MILRPGQWLGKGSLLVEGASLGAPIEVEVAITETDDGLTVAGELTEQDKAGREVSLRVVPNDVGTYTLDVYVLGLPLRGTAKLDSVPNLGLLWNDDSSVNATCAIFELAGGGYGCRGFVRDARTTFTWEIAFHLKQHVLKGDNVVSLARRRR